MRINLGGRDIGVPQHDLHTTQVGAALQQVGGEAVTKHMGRKPMEYPCFPAVSGQKFPKRLAGEATAARGYKKVSAGPALEQSAAAVCEIIFDGADGSLPDWHQTLFITLAGSSQNTKVQVDVADSQPAQLRNPQTSGVNQFQHSAIPQTRGAGTVGHRDNSLDLL
jgi:hypothetical protein